MKWIKFLILVSFLTLLPAKSFAQTDPRQFDVAGIKLGMTADEVKRIIKSMPDGNKIENLGAQTMTLCAEQQAEMTAYRERTGNQLQPPKPQCLQSIVYSHSEDSINQISIVITFVEDFPNRPKQDVVYAISFDQKFPKGYNWNEPQQRLLQKYGNPTFCIQTGAPAKCKLDWRNEMQVWMLDGAREVVTADLLALVRLAETLHLRVQQLGNYYGVVMHLENIPFYKEKQRVLNQYLASVAQNARPQAKPLRF